MRAARGATKARGHQDGGRGRGHERGGQLTAPAMFSGTGPQSSGMPYSSLQGGGGHSIQVNRWSGC